ncbi:MAG: protein TolQ [Acidobacteria bacterium]|nr:protein TolQ [Acidobacteriota bacterium]MCG2814793.1 protein TolQ [Candidatus Aminicenantes bacterium]
MNFFKLILEASLVVKLVILVLLFFSVFSWAVIFFKRNSIKTAKAQNRKFLAVFRKSRNLSEVGEAAKQLKNSPLSTLFNYGFRELKFLKKANPEMPLTAQNVETIQRGLIKGSNKEINRLEKMMPFLATTGSVTPFIGLFGTVWGIMNSFTQIGIEKTASLQTVAPGIAEALIATALGLFAAIPAVIGYNHFLGQIKEQVVDMEDFTLEFLSITERLYGD